MIWLKNYAPAPGCINCGKCASLQIDDGHWAPRGDWCGEDETMDISQDMPVESCPLYDRSAMLCPECGQPLYECKAHPALTGKYVCANYPCTWRGEDEDLALCIVDALADAGDEWADHLSLLMLERAGVQLVVDDQGQHPNYDEVA